MTETTAIRTATDVAAIASKKQRAPRTANGTRRPRRVFTGDYKLAILAEYDRCTHP